MKIFYLFFVFTLFATLSMACHNQKKELDSDEKIEDVSIEEEDIDFDPEEIDSFQKFDSLKDWLSAICKGKKPEKSIDDYIFSLSRLEQKDTVKYALCIVGKNTNEISKNHSKIIVDYIPENPCYILPATEFNHLDLFTAGSHLGIQLREFTKTDMFKNSFLANAKSLDGEWNGKIWERMD